MFYISIFVGCLITALILPWLFRLISATGKSIYRAVLPRADSGPTSHLSSYSSRQISSNSPAVVPGSCNVKSYSDVHSDGDNTYFGPRKEYSSPRQAQVQLKSAGWISREDRITTGGRTYKVSRRVKAREEQPEHVNKPASWHEKSRNL